VKHETNKRNGIEKEMTKNRPHVMKEPRSAKIQLALTGNGPSVAPGGRKKERKNEKKNNFP